jgi:hypothetical protein
MIRSAGGILALLLAPLALAAQDKPKDQPASPAQQYQALIKEYGDAMTAFSKAYQDAKTAEDKQKVVREKYPNRDQFSAKFLALAEKNPKDAVAIDALTWIMTNPVLPLAGAKEDPKAKALDLLLRDHVQSDKLGRICPYLTGIDKQTETLLRAVREKNPHKDVQAEACLALAQQQRGRATLARRLQNDPDLVKRYTQFYGKEAADELLKVDAAKAEAESAKLYGELADKHLAQLKPERLAALCPRLSAAGDKDSEKILRTLLDKDARRDVQGVACLALAQLLKKQADGLTASDAKAADKVRKESEDLFDRAVTKFADVKTFPRGTVGDKAKGELNELRSLGIGKVVPEITGEDIDGKKFKLSNYRGKVVLLDFWGNW